jgi:hypothetical protein
MPSMETSNLNQHAVVWSPNGHSRTGDKKVNAGIELKVRWEDLTLTDRPSKGDEQQYDARVIVKQDVDIGSIFWQGKESELPDPVTNVDTLYEVIEFRKTPDVKGRNFRRVCYLSKWSNTLPDVV